MKLPYIPSTRPYFSYSMVALLTLGVSITTACSDDDTEPGPTTVGTGGTGGTGGSGATGGDGGNGAAGGGDGGMDQTGGMDGVGGGAGGGTGGGGMTATGASCADPISLTAGWYATDFDSTGSVDDYSVYECGGTQTAAGEDMVFSVDVPDESYLVVTQDPDFEGALALLSDCDPTMSEACIDYDASGGIHSLVHLNNSGMAESYFLFSDAVATNTAGPILDLGVGIYDPAAGGELCNDAIALNSVDVRTAGGLFKVHGSMGYSADYNPAAALGCIGLVTPNTAGRDAVFSVTIDDGETITASVTSLQNDVNSIYLLTGDCNDPAGQCEDGSTTGGEVSYTSSVNNTNVFIVVDTASNTDSDSGFILNAEVSM